MFYRLCMLNNRICRATFIREKGNLTSGLHIEVIISGEPLAKRSKWELSRVLAMTDILCNLEENGNWRRIPTSNGMFWKNKKTHYNVTVTVKISLNIYNYIYMKQRSETFEDRNLLLWWVKLEKTKGNITRIHHLTYLLIQSVQIGLTVTLSEQWMVLSSLVELQPPV